MSILGLKGLNIMSTSSLLLKLATNRLLSLLNDFVFLALRSFRFMVSSFYALQWLDLFYDVVAWFDLDSDRVFRQDLDENLHSASQAKNKVKY